MNRAVWFGGSLVAGMLVASVAGAVPVTFCKTGGINLVTTGCISGTSKGYPGGGDGVFSEPGGGDFESAVEAAILGATGSAVDVSLYGKSDSNASLFSFTGFPGNSGTWDVLNDAIAIAYITIKAAHSFVLFDVQGANSGSWTTLGLLTDPGGSGQPQQPGVSHISFWTVGDGVSEVPLPAALPLFVTALAGGGLLSWRRRRTAA